MIPPSRLCALFAFCIFGVSAVFSRTINIDFSRDETGPLGGPADALHTGTGPAPDTGTIWNDYSIPMTGVGNTIPAGYVRSDLTDSAGATTTVDVAMTSGWYRAFNTNTPAWNDLQQEWVFVDGGNMATLTVSGLDTAHVYDFYFIGSGNSSTSVTRFTIGATSKVANGTLGDGTTWTEGTHHTVIKNVTPDASGNVTVNVQSTGTANGILGAMQIVSSEPPAPAVNFLYANSVATTGGELDVFHSPSNLMNNRFTSPQDVIDATLLYPSQGNNHASTDPAPAAFDLIFEFNTTTDVNGIHVWNFVYRTGTTGSSAEGVNAYELTFHSAPNGGGNTIGTVVQGTLARAAVNAQNRAQSIFFPIAYAGVRSVVMKVSSNHGGSLTGMSEFAFNAVASPPPATAIQSFTSSAPFVQTPAKMTLDWEVSGNVVLLEIQPDIGDVRGRTQNGKGSIEIPHLIGEKTYTLTLNGAIKETLSVVGLPAKNKVHLYLLIGQSNMQGAGAPFNASADAPHPRVVKFGSHDGMEKIFVKGSHSLVVLGTTNTGVGLGIEFGKTLLASQSDPEVVIGIVNHALGSTAIQWWAPDVGLPAANWPNRTGEKLYNDAIIRIHDAKQFGVLKGVLWHQGEYNSIGASNPDKNPPAEPQLYASRLRALVDNLRFSFGDRSLPVVCGKLVKEYKDSGGNIQPYNVLTDRGPVEAALGDLPNQRTNTACVDNSGVYGRSDQAIHFDSASQRELGKRYANAMNTLRADAFRLYLGGFYTPAEMNDPAISSPQNDNDRDGSNNFLEFAFLSDPSRGASVPRMSTEAITIPEEGKFLSITYRQRTDDDAPSYVAEVSSNLSAWANNGGGTSVTTAVGLPIDNGDGTATVMVRDRTAITPETPFRFMRLSVTGN